MNKSILNTSRFITVAIISLLFIFSCKKDPIGPIDGGKPLVTETIGPNGGTVGTEDVSIDIPAGAFNDDNIIKISEVTENGSFGDNSVSKQYKLSGIPNDYSKSIKINIKYTGEITNESFIAIGAMQYDFVEGDSTIVYNLNTAVDSSGYLVYELPKNSININLGKVGSSFYKPNNIFLDLFVSAINGFQIGQTDHFILQYPNQVLQYMATIGVIFEDVFKIVTKDLGIFYNEQYLRWVIEVYDNGEEFLIGNTLNHTPTFGIYEGYISDNVLNKIKIESGKEMIENEVETLYSLDTVEDWLLYTVRYWSEELFTDDANYKNPPNFQNNAIAPFNGMEINTSNNQLILEHAKGMSSVIKYLTDSDKFGKAGIGKMYQYISNDTDEKSTGALLRTMDDLTPDWWPDFFKEYVSGNIYNVPFSYFQGNLSGNWSIDDAADTSQVFTHNYQDLSAKMFEISLANDIFDETNNLLLSMDVSGGLDGLALVVFGIKNGTPTYLGTAKGGDFVIPNLKSYWDDTMNKFLVVLVNSLVTSDDYLGETDIDLNVKVEDGADLSKYKKCEVTIKVFTNVHYEYYGSLPDTTISSHFRIGSIFPAIGSFTGNTFTGTYNHLSDTGNYTWSGTMTVTVNNSATAVTDIKWDSKDYSPGGTNTEKGFAGTNTTIPLIATNPSWNILKFGRFSHNTDDVLEGITDVYYDHYQYSSQSLLYRQWFNEFSHGDRSDMEITFKEE